ncbi:PspC domain-containing protein [Brevibacillus dissolubilis]|uniref:PspC domain-containing protein n=1 Tax=Brevibacillus dissolubilis TaxID=1844116 RepID=UPI001117954A|nr:PspC domain-containing protein [Brevibacillus dissolubilis]
MNRLYRSMDDKRIFGVCGGIARFINVDSTLVRIAVIFLTIFTGIPVVVYLMLAFLMPKEQPEWTSFGRMPFTDDGFGVQPNNRNLDEEIDRLEKRALQEEVYRLRAELAKFQTQ